MITTMHEETGLMAGVEGGECVMCGWLGVVCRLVLYIWTTIHDMLSCDEPQANPSR